MGDLGQRPDRRLGDPFDAGLSSRLQSDDDRYGFVVVEDERGHRRTRGELVSAVHSRRRLHGIPEVTQPLDVAPNGPDRHLEAACEVVAGPVPMVLKEREQTERSGTRIGHVVRLFRIQDRNWPHWFVR